MGHTHLIPEPYYPQLLTIFSPQSTLRTCAVERESLKSLGEGYIIGQLHYVVKVISHNMFIMHLTSLADNYLGNTVILRQKNFLEVRRSVHRNINLTDRANKMQPCSRIIIPMFLNCLKCFGRHTAHHQELRNCNCSLWFYIRFWLPAAAIAAAGNQKRM